MYDVAALPSEALADVERTHPRSAKVRSVGSVRDTWIRARARGHLAAPAGDAADAQRLDFTAVPKPRHAAAESGAKRGLSSDRLTDLLIAIGAKSAATASRTLGTVAPCCAGETESLVYEVRDGGHIEDLLAGRLPPPAEQESGRGLLIGQPLV